MPAPDRLPHGTSRRAGWWRLRLVAVVLGVAAGVILFSVFIVTRQTDLAEGTPVPVTGTPGTSAAMSAGANVATPEGDTVAWPAGSLPALLALAPDQLAGEENGLPIQATYANLPLWLERQGLDPGELTDIDLAHVLEPLALPDVLETRGLSPEWRAMYGFDLRQVDQVLTVGHAPNQILIMPGRYDAHTLLTTWAENGYQAVEVEEMTVWSLFPGDRIDLSAPASRPALGSMNTVVLLDDGTLIATARQSRMAEALRAVRGGDSLLDNDGLRDAAVLEANASASSVVIASGHLMQRPVSGETIPGPAASPPAQGAAEAGTELPPVDLLVFALDGPEGDDGRAITMTMVYDPPPDDVDEIPDVVTSRVAADTEWSTRYRLDAIKVTGEDGAMIQVRIVPAEDGQSIIDDRDFGPFGWTTREQAYRARSITWSSPV